MSSTPNRTCPNQQVSKLERDGDLWTGRGIIAAGLAVGLMLRLAFIVRYPGVEISRIAGAAPARTIAAVQVPGRRSPAAAPMIECLRRAAGARPRTRRGSAG